MSFGDFLLLTPRAEFSDLWDSLRREYEGELLDVQKWLDARLREEVRGKIRDLAKQLGSTVLYVTHDQIEAMTMADRIGVINQGRLVQVGTPREIYESPRNLYVASRLGTEQGLPTDNAYAVLREKGEAAETLVVGTRWWRGGASTRGSG